jgi:hypothetical protein
MLGDMYLMAGMFGDAIQCYDDGAEKARNVGDVLWEGLAREGRAVAGIGEAWEGRDGSVSDNVSLGKSPTDHLSEHSSTFSLLPDTGRDSHPLSFIPGVHFPFAITLSTHSLLPFAASGIGQHLLRSIVII